MKTTATGLALLVSLLAIPPASLAQAPQGSSGPRTDGNLQSGAAMNDAQKQSSGTGSTGSTAQPVPQTHSPRPPGASNTPAQGRPEGNLGSGAAMSGAQRNSAGAAATGGAPPPQLPSTTAPSSPGTGSPSR
ncbi:hypothetical protein [Pseudoroseomonas ludipueritiae]|uniref:Translation initiation factor IF-2 n=1 Tax=Pseudoroseomonas ludipueritiae TaxID=198093 RepID=A0ABR7RB03_9PROT|nr:hypothetical protein [Pseudoroseomonas ludipueritiae]MBC9178878.1 hypothetical protein [Pseudoroseomonas ludipueritiae]MCG7363291.1 hypothetical protein [Roseomonas sp. ACRSG]